MNLRPRCREWLPLATQQLRLRNLARIQGLNIECKAVGVDVGDLLIYYTLHTEQESETFYTSEALPQRHQHQKWAEICAGDDIWRKSNAQCVCVKVWARYQPAESESESEGDSPQLSNREPQSALEQRLADVSLTPQKLPRPPELLFSWGVYFSGLIPLSPLSLSKLRSNCLIFQLNGEQFTSPSLISAEGLQAQLLWHYEKYADGESERETPAGINSPPVSRSSSPLLRLKSTRYAQLCCEASDVRRSYDLEQLLQLQRLQRGQQQKLRQSAEIGTDIARLSVRCITRNELRFKPRTTSMSGGGGGSEQLHHHSMGRTLSVLLAEQQQLAPLTLYEAQRLTQQIEALRCQQRLLQSEREIGKERNSRLQQRLERLSEARLALQIQLEQQQQKLREQRQELAAQAQQRQTQRESRRQIVRQVERRMSTLVIELQDIYNLQILNASQFSICGIAFPHLEPYASDAREITNAQLLENVSPLAVSAALGYAAHLVQMLASIMDRPLRNPISYEPSRSRIADEIKELSSYNSREFPLYTRSILPSQPAKYAIYLLRQNVAQLCFDITGSCDLRNTFGNLLELFNTLRQIERSQREPAASAEPTASLINGLTGQQLSQSHSSVDMNHVAMPTPAATVKDALRPLLLPPGVSQALAIEGYASTQRICRSVGSYSDGEDDFRPILEHNYSNSDSNIALQTERSS